MARKSPSVANTGCTWPMCRIFNFSDNHSKTRLVSAAGNGNLRSSSDLIGTVDEKYPNIGVSSGRRYLSCKSISNVKNDQVTDPRNEVTEMIIDQRFANKKFLGKDGAGYQPDELLDAVQILYSNKELFLKLLKDPNSVLVKQIHELPSSQVKKPYQAFSHSSFSHNVQHVKPSNLKFGRIKRKSRYVVKVRREKQQQRTTNGVPYRFTCGCHGIEDGKKVNELKIAGRSSPNCVHSSTKKGLNSYLDWRKKDKLNKVNDSELCTRHEEVASFGESSSNSRNTDNPLNPSEQDILKNLHVEGSKSLSEMLNFGVEEFKRRTNSLGRTSPLPDFKSFRSLPRHCEHDSVTEGMKNDHQVLIRTKLGLRKEGENSFFSSSGQKTNDQPEAIVKIPSQSSQIFDSDISIRKSPHGHNIHTHYDITRGSGFKDTPTQNFDINNALGGNGTILDSYPKSHIFSFSSEVASSSPSPSQRIEDNINMRNKIEHPSTEPVVKNFTKEVVTNSKMTLHKPDKSPVIHFEDLMRPSLDLTNNLTSSKDILDYVMEIIHSLSLKCDELFMKCESSNQMLDLSTFDELNRLLTSQLSSNKILLHCVIETLIEVYKNNGFPPKRLDIQAYIVNIVMVKEIAALINLHYVPHPSPITVEQLVEKDFAKCGSWLNIKVGIEDIMIEVEEDVLEKMVLEIVSEMDIRSIIHCNQ
ncbi:PREDICTED: uncharacterized protein LOC109332383 isoform X2 [Lupinus angustifolius]|uniref:uncharacterized protein LOC109332383 isoform X2 n=1 Tax=Lupinus angustifolius TaxID=3871 RepID=UPI00092F55DE|nr:PREDICTED: uncharacterized protein LOC109332383 isoform X2 [Lupinus angustifolius]